MITAIYARVSTDDKGQDPLNQVMSMPEHQLSFVDHASGKSGDREQLAMPVPDVHSEIAEEYRRQRGVDALKLARAKGKMNIRLCARDR